MKIDSVKLYAAGALAVAAIFFFAARGAVSGSYHASGTTLICSECHTMHYLENGAMPANADVGGPFDKLLLKTNICNLCLVCHDNDGGGSAPNQAPDVMGIASANQATNRAGGAFRAASGGTTPQAHDICNITAQTAPGSNPVYTTTAGRGLTCIECHDPHGNGYFRNLEPQPANRAVTAVYVQTGGTDVTETAVTPTTTQYNVTNIIYRSDKMSRWCATCHNNFYLSAYAGTFTNDANVAGSDAGDTTAGTTDQWKRHPASHVSFTEANTNTHADSAYWLANTSRTPYIDVTGAGASADDMPFCGSCHQSHGSDRNRTTATGWPKNMIYDDRSTAAVQDGTSLNQTCNLCHNQ